MAIHGNSWQFMLKIKQQEQPKTTIKSPCRHRAAGAMYGMECHDED